MSRVDEHLDAGGLDHGVVGARLGIETDQIFVAGAAAGFDHDAQSRLGLAGASHGVLDRRGSFRGEDDHAGSPRSKLLLEHLEHQEQRPCQAFALAIYH